MKAINETTLLLVDDEEITIELLYPLLSDFYKKVLVASNGEDGLKAFEKFNPDVILTDFMMPNMDGLQMIEKIQKSYSDIPFVVTTGVSSDKRVLKKIDDMGGYYLHKPVDLDEMFEVLKKAQGID